MKIMEERHILEDDDRTHVDVEKPFTGFEVNDTIISDAATRSIGIGGKILIVGILVVREIKEQSQ